MLKRIAINQWTEAHELPIAHETLRSGDYVTIVDNRAHKMRLGDAPLYGMAMRDAEAGDPALVVSGIENGTILSVWVVEEQQ